MEQAEMNTLDEKRQGLKTAETMSEQGFTLIETVIALLIMMIAGLGIASLFAFSINYNSGANDRALAQVVAQQQMERLRQSAFSDASLITPSSTETVVSAGRSYTVLTTICADAAAGCGGSATLKKLTVQVTPQGAGAAWVRSSVRIETLRANTATGSYF
ncbi:MAG: prepilin-type N-terminal cleavage/methylation domain-containing protein [Pyrinomonadaceae bacterium]